MSRSHQASEMVTHRCDDRIGGLAEQRAKGDGEGPLRLRFIINSYCADRAKDPLQYLPGKAGLLCGE